MTGKPIAAFTATENRATSGHYVSFRVDVA